VLAAVNGALPDRVPMDFHGNSFVLDRLKSQLGVDNHRDLLESLHSDVVDLRGTADPVYRGPVPFTQELGDGVRENFWGWRRKTVEAACGPEEQFVDFVLSDASSVDDLRRHRWPSADWFDFSDFARRLEPWSDFAVMATGVSVLQHPSFLRGIDSLMLDMAAEPEMAHYLMDRFTDFYMEYFDRMLTAADGQIDIVRQADDLGTQQSLFFSPEMFRTFIKPRVARFVDLAHSHEVAFMFHSCGSIQPLIEDLIEIGVDILDPLQAAAAGMEPDVLKDRFGDRLCLHGGIDTQYLLPEGSPDEVRSEVRRVAEILGHGGGYILAPCHVLQLDVPTANVRAMSETGLTLSYADSGALG
jgi:uroporphyrinogen decarboxylase